MKDPGQLEPRAVVETFWAAMRYNDWDAAGAVLADAAVVDYICSGERFNRERWVEIQGAYPAAGRWTFDLHRMVVDGNSVVSEVTVSDGEVDARVVVFSEILAGRIARQVEYWPTALRATRMAGGVSRTHRIGSP